MLLRKHYGCSPLEESCLRQCHTCTMERFMSSLQIDLTSLPMATRPSGTSDYGTCTCSGSIETHLKPESRVWSDSSSCHGDYDSGSRLSLGSETYSPFTDECATTKLHSTSSDDEDSTFFEMCSRTLPDHSRILRYKKVTAVIPAHNQNAITPSEFSLDVVEDLFYTPELTERTSMLASQVISLGPHGACFHPDEPALIYLPLGVQVDEPDSIVCLCSDTIPGEIPDWKPLPKSHYHYISRENKLMIRAWHFSLFTAIISMPYPEVRRVIKPNKPETLEIPEVPGVKVSFSKQTLQREFESSLKVCYCDDPALPENGENGYVNGHKTESLIKALATPIIELGPHDVRFDTKVKIQLPLPDCHRIIQHFDMNPKTDLTLFQAKSTEDSKNIDWQPYSTEYHIHQDDELNFYITFYVEHFTWYKTLWDTLANAMSSAKMGVTYLYPRIRFSMMCTAMMDETQESKSFGMEIICYRSDKKLPEIGNYKHRVGGSTKPKFVRPGSISIRLVSQAFEADIVHGEDPSLCKEEPDFRGMEFEKQFACKYTNESIKKGNIGKCLVERTGGGFTENIFEFNLTKYGNESEAMPEPTDCWSLTATRELASMLTITSDDNWKVFARHLGFTNHEINRNLSATADPFALMISHFQSRGGTPDEFVQALYAVGRDLRGTEPAPNFMFSRPSTSAGFRSTSEEDSEDASPRRPMTPTRKRRLNPLVSSGKRKRSDQSESAVSSLSSHHTDLLHRSNLTRLETPDLWKMSQFINQNWRSLGRVLSVSEEDLTNVQHLHKDIRECAYQMLLKWKEQFPTKCTYGGLYQALCESGLNSVATAHCIGPRSPKSI